MNVHTADTVVILKRFRDIFRLDMDDDYYTPESCGWRHPNFMIDAGMEIDWGNLVQHGLLETTDGSGGDWYRATEKCFNTVWDIEHPEPKSNDDFPQMLADAKRRMQEQQEVTDDEPT